jgi:hypothetical protein
MFKKLQQLSFFEMIVVAFITWGWTELLMLGRGSGLWHFDADA